MKNKKKSTVSQDLQRNLSVLQLLCTSRQCSSPVRVRAYTQTLTSGGDCKSSWHDEMVRTSPAPWLIFTVKGNRQCPTAHNANFWHISVNFIPNLWWRAVTNATVHHVWHWAIVIQKVITAQIIRCVRTQSDQRKMNGLSSLKSCCTPIFCVHCLLWDIKISQVSILFYALHCETVTLRIRCFQIHCLLMEPSHAMWQAMWQQQIIMPLMDCSVQRLSAVRAHRRWFLQGGAGRLAGGQALAVPRSDACQPRLVWAGECDDLSTSNLLVAALTD